MVWADKVVNALHDGDCFISAIHRANFINLLDEIRKYPFFCKQLCKCAFIASWNQEHVAIFHQIMKELLERHATDCSYMLERFRSLTQNLNRNESLLFRLNVDFLSNPGETPDESCLIKLSRSWVPIGDSALVASQIIDAL